MGCHTWYKKPIAKGRKEIKDYLIKEAEQKRTEKFWSNSDELALDIRLSIIDNLQEDVTDEVSDAYIYSMYTIYFLDGEPILYDTSEFGLDEPRISGYPAVVIRSADQMFKAMETGLRGFDGVVRDFHDVEDIEYVKGYILSFFNKYPDGIITFG